MVEGGSDLRAMLVMFVAGGLVRVCTLLIPVTLTSDFAAFFTIAQGAAQGIDAFGTLYPPGQPAWLSIWIRLFGPQQTALQIVQHALALVTIPLLFYAVRAYSRPAARWAAFVAAFSPPLLVWPLTLGHETTDLFLISGVLFCSACGLRTGKAKWWVLAGVCCACVTLMWPVMVVLPFLIGVAIWLAGYKPKRSLAIAAVIAALMVAAISPWVGRNYRVYGQLVLVATNFGTVLYSSNGPGSDGIASTHCTPADLHTDLRGAALNAYCTQAALSNIRNNPLLFLAQSAKRVAFFWGTDAASLTGVTPQTSRLYTPLAAIHQFAWALLILAWAASCWFCPMHVEKESPVVYTAVLIVALLWTTHAVMEPFTRHHFALIPLISIIAALKFRYAPATTS